MSGITYSIKEIPMSPCSIQLIQTNMDKFFVDSRSAVMVYTHQNEVTAKKTLSCFYSKYFAKSMPFPDIKENPDDSVHVCTYITASGHEARCLSMEGLKFLCGNISCEVAKRDPGHRERFLAIIEEFKSTQIQNHFHTSPAREAPPLKRRAIGSGTKVQLAKTVANITAQTVLEPVSKHLEQTASHLGDLSSGQQQMMSSQEQILASGKANMEILADLAKGASEMADKMDCKQNEVLAGQEKLLAGQKKTEAKYDELLQMYTKLEEECFYKQILIDDFKQEKQSMILDHEREITDLKDRLGKAEASRNSALWDKSRLQQRLDQTLASNPTVEGINTILQKIQAFEGKFDQFEELESRRNKVLNAKHDMTRDFLNEHFTKVTKSSVHTQTFNLKSSISTQTSELEKGKSLKVRDWEAECGEALAIAETYADMIISNNWDDCFPERCNLKSIASLVGVAYEDSDEESGKRGDSDAKIRRNILLKVHPDKNKNADKKMRILYDKITCRLNDKDSPSEVSCKQS